MIDVVMRTNVDVSSYINIVQHGLTIFIGRQTLSYYDILSVEYTELPQEYCKSRIIQRQGCFLKLKR